MLRGAGKVPIIFFDKSLNSITIRDTPQVVEMAEKLIRLWDKPKGEVVIDIEIMEVSRTRLRQLGVVLDTSSIGSGTAASPPPKTRRPGGTSRASTWARAPNYYMTLPSAYLQFLETDSDTKMVAQPRLRGFADEEIHHLVGEKIPVPQTTWNPIAAGGYSQQPVTPINTRTSASTSSSRRKSISKKKSPWPWKSR